MAPPGHPDPEIDRVRAVLAELSPAPVAWAEAAKDLPRRMAGRLGEGEPVSDRLGSESDWHDAVLAEERRGEPLAAVELAQQALADHPDSLWLRHRAVLALARAGATRRAMERFEAFGLDGSEDPEVAALGARIAKDVALAEKRLPAILAARDRYAAIHARRPDYYPAVNAASLSLAAGDTVAAERFAREALTLTKTTDPVTYYSVASAAEAHLVLGQVEAAELAIASAADRHEDDYGAVATTRRQLRLICDLRDIDTSILDRLTGPRVAHFCGHRTASLGVAGRFPAIEEAQVAAAIAGTLNKHPVGIAYGSLAAGADILWAEALLRCGAELHVVLPFEIEAFVAASVEPSGSGWTERFDTCLAAATSVATAFKDAPVNDDSSFRFGAQYAMGLALLRARHLESGVLQFAVWDGRPADGDAGTTLDVQAWRSTGHETIVVDPSGAVPSNSPEVRALDRAPVALLILDGDVTHPVLAETLDASAIDIARRDLAGASLYLRLASAADAARLALLVQERVEGLDIRVNAFLESDAPVDAPTPSGEVYVTEPFAAAVELGVAGKFTCDYVGHLPGDGRAAVRTRMHRLRRR